MNSPDLAVKIVRNQLSDLLEQEVSDADLELGFFELGGHSLIAMRLVARIEEELKVSMSVRQLVDCESVLEFCRLINSRLS